MPEERRIQPLDSGVRPRVTTQNSEAWLIVGKFRKQIHVGRIKMPEKHLWCPILIWPLLPNLVAVMGEG